MILGFHFIFSAYGFWLPNDPRGSWSDVVREWELLLFGPATKVSTTRSLAGDPHDAALRRAAKQALRHPPVRFNAAQREAIAAGFAEAAGESGYRVHALAIMPDHAHLVMARHVTHIDRIASHLKAKATMQLNQAGLAPLTAYRSPTGRVPSPWARKYWCPFIDDAAHMRAAIRYVQQNPIKAGLPAQGWDWLVPFRG